MNKTASFYLLREISAIFLIGLMTITVILLMDKILKLIELIVTRGVGFSHLLKLLLFISPSFLVFTVPIAFLLATLLAFGRLSGDNEITAFKASGVSLFQLYLPVFLFSVGAFLLTAFLVLYGLPWGNRGFKATLFHLAQSRVDADIKERVFNDAFEGFVIYVDRVPLQGRKIEGILIHDERDKEKIHTIFAQEGFLVNNPNSQEVILRLLKGDIHRYEPKTNTFQRMRFDTYDLRLELSKTFAALGRKLKEHEMSVDEIKSLMAKKRALGEDTTSQEVELQKRYAIPFSCLVFGLLGVPLGIQPRRSGRSYGFLLTLILLLLYYISLTATEIFALKKAIPPFLAGWLPNLCFGALGTYLFIRTAKEVPFRPALYMAEALDWLQRKLKGDRQDV
ncbi:MAG: LPS export ABC transporter permease LptF [Desulfobacterota bacterium]|nr:LPS export ABC transporter permease LptF [Thermodesulfobacteriota bacterium]